MKNDEEDKHEGKEALDDSEEKKKEVSNEVAEIKDRLLRLAAEFDNYKKRSVKEADAAKTIGKAELMRRLLPVLDEFGLAMEAIEAKSEMNKGIALVFSNFSETLKKEGLREIDASGPSDPYKHEVILTRTSDKKDGEILEVVRKGYEMNGIMLRPASVIVSKEALQGADKKV